MTCYEHAFFSKNINNHNKRPFRLPLPIISLIIIRSYILICLSRSSVGSTFLLFCLIYKSFTFFFGSDKIPIAVKTVQYGTLVIDVTSVTVPATQPAAEEKVIQTEEAKNEPATQAKRSMTKVKKGYVDDTPYIPWIIYTLVFLLYMFLIFKLSKKSWPRKRSSRPYSFKKML